MGVEKNNFAKQQATSMYQKVTPRRSILEKSNQDCHVQMRSWLAKLIELEAHAEARISWQVYP